VDFSFSEDQQALRELARKILEDRAGHERLKEIEQTDERVDRELWRELAKSSLLGVPVEEAFGGSWLGLFDLAILLEEAGRAVAPVPLWETLVLGALPIQRFGSQEQKRRFLPRVAEGSVFLTAALEEPGASSPGAPATRASRDGDGWRLEGTKSLVPAAHVAERVLVPARSEDGVGLFLVDPQAAGISATRQVATTGDPRFDLALAGVRVRAEDVLARAGGEAIDWTRERAVAGVCALQLGVVDKALERTAEYARERRQFDRPIGSFQAVHQRAADAYADVEAIRLTLWQPLHRLEQGVPAAEALAIAKFWASEAGNRVAYAAQHLHGGIGIDMDYPLHRHYLRARDLALTLGPASAQLAQLGGMIAGDAG
jgi:alkylation response protein AidB-like acyl-CoA dehydrogenase